jgi:hypothetical protein
VLLKVKEDRLEELFDELQEELQEELFDEPHDGSPEDEDNPFFIFHYSQKILKFPSYF